MDNNLNAKVSRISEAPKHYYTEQAHALLKTHGELKKAVIQKFEKTKTIDLEKVSAATETKKEAVKRLFLKLKTVTFEKSNNCYKKAKEIFCDLKEKAETFIEIKGHDNIIKGVLVSSIAVVCVLVFALTFTFGYTIKSGDRVLGYVDSKKLCDTLLSEIADEIYNASGENFVLGENVSFSPAIILKNKILSNENAKEVLKSTSGDMIPAYSVSVNGNMILALPNEQMANNAVYEYRNSFYADMENVVSEFAEDVTIKYEYVPKSILRTEKSAIDFLEEGKFIFYTAGKTETVASVAEKNNTTTEEIIATNSLEKDYIVPGQVIKIYTGEHFSDVLATEHSEREEEIPFETISEENAELYKGQTKVKTAGENGVKFIEENIMYINGVEAKRDVIQENILKASTVQVEYVGTKELPPDVGTGTLIKPAGGSLSSRFGSRWGRRHTGVDYSAPVGTPIYAADNGKVISAGYDNGGYGYLIQIDHGNGTVTYYAHCSEILVSEGQVVAKGDLIAKVGNTGRSTGAHLHFEVRKNGTPVDPMQYVN